MISKYQKLIIFLSSLILCHNSIFSQNQERVSELYNYVIDALDQKDWETLDKHCTQLIKEVRSPDFADLVSIVSYMHIHAISALMNERKISQNEAIKKAKGYKGKVLIMPGHPFKEKCMFNCLYPTKENVKVLHCTSSDEKGTLIYSFEYYEMDEALRESFLTENEGKEMKMPVGLSFFDKDGTERTEIRTKWWENPELSTYKQISVLPLDQLPDLPIDISVLPQTNYYNENQKPVFFGHYWLKGAPSLQKSNVCCLDYSVAKKGHLVAYRFDNEQILSNEKFVYV